MGSTGRGNRVNRIDSIVGRSRIDLVSPERFNAELRGSNYIKPENFYTAVQNASNGGDTIYELHPDLSVSQITASDRSDRMLVNGDWTSRVNTTKYMDEKQNKGSRFFYR